MSPILFKYSSIAIYYTPQNSMPPLVVLVFWSKCLKFAKFLASCTKGQPTSNHVYLLERPSLEQVGRNSHLLQTKAIKSVMDTWPPSNIVRRTPHTSWGFPLAMDQTFWWWYTVGWLGQLRNSVQIWKTKILWHIQ